MYEFNDEQLGKIIVKPNIRAKSVIARKTKNQIQLAVPYGFNLNDLVTILDEMRPKLLNIAVREIPKIKEDTLIETFSFTARLSRMKQMQEAQMTLKNGEMIVFIPSDFNLESERAQHIVKEMIKAGLRHEAKRILLKKTLTFAKRFNLQVNDVKINKSTSRWGSCSGKKNINFSLFLMLLPERCIDYVILHELAHTVEMNHSEKFWKLLSEFCGEDARKLGKEITKNTPETYSMLAM